MSFLSFLQVVLRIITFQLRKIHYVHVIYIYIYIYIKRKDNVKLNTVTSVVIRLFTIIIIIELYTDRRRGDARETD